LLERHETSGYVVTEILAGKVAFCFRQAQFALRNDSTNCLSDKDVVSGAHQEDSLIDWSFPGKG